MHKRTFIVREIKKVHRAITGTICLKVNFYECTNLSDNTFPIKEKKKNLKWNSNIVHRKILVKIAFAG